MNWTFVEHSWSDTSIYDGDERIALISIRDRATESNQEELEIEANRNAKLMTAAPEMYEALKNLENDDEAIPDHAWDLVKSAILKAEKGRSG